MTVDCDTCFNKKNYPEKVAQLICNRCKEQQMRHYRPDLTNVEGYVTVIKENNG